MERHLTSNQIYAGSSPVGSFKKYIMSLGLMKSFGRHKEEMSCLNET